MILTEIGIGEDMYNPVCKFLIVSSRSPNVFTEE